jgi:hypothetical protein
MWRLHAQRLLIGKTYTTPERTALLNSLETILNRRAMDVVELDAPVIRRAHPHGAERRCPMSSGSGKATCLQA